MVTANDQSWLTLLEAEPEDAISLQVEFSLTCFRNLALVLENHDGLTSLGVISLGYRSSSSRHIAAHQPCCLLGNLPFPCLPTQVSSLLGEPFKSHSRVSDQNFKLETHWWRKEKQKKRAQGKDCVF